MDGGGTAAWGSRRARTRGGQPTDAQRVAYHPPYLDAPVDELEIVPGRAFNWGGALLKSRLPGALRTGYAVDDVEMAYEPTA
ncbi:hypothetical protein [Streptomyces sp. NPDC050287]|uniref:hypothetical protein n=1 Tax=Streptomyces sp. NPDC050287 TaxID=3365608 RepID=UPI00379AC191